MSAEKLSREEVPQKFVEWLLDMGYPESKIPSLEKVTQKCRGQYYMVWRSLMEHVWPKDEIREKRLNVFCDDVALCKKSNVFNERNSSVVVPEQILLWREFEDIQTKVASAEARVTEARQKLHQLLDKVSSKVCQRDIICKRIQEKQRRVGLLQHLLADLTVKKTNLEETRQIADSLCSVNNDEDLQDKVDRCIGLLRRHGAPVTSRSLLASNSITSTSTVMPNGDDTEDQLSALAHCRGDVLWSRLSERRSNLTAELARATSKSPTKTSNDHGNRVQGVVARTADLHCTVALDAMKIRAHIKQTRGRLATYISDFNDRMSNAACELLVVRCERASAEARASSLRTSLNDLGTGGLFEVGRVGQPVSAKQIADLDRNIQNSRDELKRLVLSLATTEKKIVGIKEVLTAVFSSFQTEIPINNFKGMQLDFPQESLSTIFKFFSEKREQQNKMELSMDFNTSENSCNNIDSSSLRFIDELRIYLKKFNLEKNRKLIVESGEKIWIFATLQSSLERLNSEWLAKGVTPLLCPSASLLNNIQRIIGIKQARAALYKAVKKLECDWNCVIDIDITTRKEQEEAAVDKMKKKIGENLLNLQKTVKTLELCQNNLKLWRDNVFKASISNNRTIDGITYKEYEFRYLETIKY